MKKLFFLLIISFQVLLGLETSDRLFDCTEVFKERKSELLVELERIDEEKQALSALQSATEELLKKKEQLTVFLKCILRIYSLELKVYKT